MSFIEIPSHLRLPFLQHDFEYTVRIACMEKRAHVRSGNIYNVFCHLNMNTNRVTDDIPDLYSMHVTIVQTITCNKIVPYLGDLKCCSIFHDSFEAYVK
jgi:hypothetical protein